MDLNLVMKALADLMRQHAVLSLCLAAAVLAVIGLGYVAMRHYFWLRSFDRDAFLAGQAQEIARLKKELEVEREQIRRTLDRDLRTTEQLRDLKAVRDEERRDATAFREKTLQELSALRSLRTEVDASRKALAEAQERSTTMQEIAAAHLVMILSLIDGFQSEEHIVKSNEAYRTPGGNQAFAAAMQNLSPEAFSRLSQGLFKYHRELPSDKRHDPFDDYDMR